MLVKVMLLHVWLHSRAREEVHGKQIAEHGCASEPQAFSSYGVRASLEESFGFGDPCCRVRVSRRKPFSAGAAPSSGGEEGSANAEQAPGSAQVQAQGKGGTGTPERKA
jgi:hypothetical protein